MRSLEEIEKNLKDNQKKLQDFEYDYQKEKDKLCDDIFHDYRIFKWIECIKELVTITNEDRKCNGLYRTIDIEMAYLFYQSGICCECDGDENKVYFKKEIG